MKITYTVAHEAWYNRRSTDKPSIQIHAEPKSEDGLNWEFVIHQDDEGIRVNVYDDAFPAFAEFPRFFEALAVERPTTLAEVAGLLNRLGALDTTERTRPSVR